MNPLISVLIPVYNAEHWLAQTIKSVLAQTWRNIEIVVVDDGSADNSLEIAQQFQSSFVKVIDQKNKGASAARNRAYRECQGDFIQYLDADDLLAPDKVERQVKMLVRAGSHYIASGAWARFYRTAYHEAVFKPQSLWTDMSPVDWLVCAWQNQLMMHPAAWLIPRKVAQQAGAWNESLSRNDDGEYFCRVVLASKGIKFCPDAKTYYRSGNSNSLSASASPSAYESEFLSWDLCTSALLSVENNPYTRHACATVFQRFIYEAYPAVPQLRSIAAARVKQFGGSNLKPDGGPIFQIMAKVLGWQSTKQLQNWAYQYGYGKAAIGWKLARLREKNA